MGKFIFKCFIMSLVHIRWFYFHINPMYMKFRMSGTESHFQHRKTGELFSNLLWKDE